LPHLTPSAIRPSRIEGIDILRGLSILAVVLHHINLRIAFADASWRLSNSSAAIERVVVCFVVITGLTAALGFLIARFYSEPLNRLLRSRLSGSSKAARARAVTR
jgi:peptidoglycan/LPS O-acetylase OafA/YrhL